MYTNYLEREEENGYSNFLGGWPSLFTVLGGRDREIVENTRSRVKIKFKLINFMKLIQIEGYNGKYESNSQGIRKILDDFFEFDQIE